MLFAIGVDASVLLGFVRYGYDRHVWDVTQPMALQARKIAFVVEELNSTSTCLTKISILFFYRRLALGTYTSLFVRIVQANILFVAAYLLIFSVVLFLTCYPFAAYWLQFDVFWSQQNTYKCLNEAATVVAANAFSILQDFIACGLPSVLLWKLQMPRRKKVLLGALLGLGIL
ncbi:integral membrane protein [Macrophomina phaseolina MS6]|uniref:Integral membrane protein n=1 Tax=Macrophomina phaseolina (strain MS6) TaxID=1126212 RepID=K2RRU6_MACPH|nr:integral membrane protein [Macrophomina phaseolina MS6]